MLPQCGLHLELWSNVIQHLSLKDTLGLACTCKQLMSLRPDICRGTDDDLEWVVDWASACALLLNLRSIYHFQEIVAGTRHLGGLEELQIKSLNCNRPRKLTIWVSCMLVQAQALRAVKLSIPEMVVIPGLTKLQHLLLTVSQKLSKEAVDHLSAAYNLPLLLTLALRFCPQRKPPPGLHEYHWRRSALPGLSGLELDSHEALTHVLLSRIAVDALTLPPGCKLTLEGSLEMCCRTWHNCWVKSDLEENLHILHVTTSKPFDQDATSHFPQGRKPIDVLRTYADKLAHIVSAEYPFLTRLYLTCCYFGTADNPISLGANFPCLTTLRLKVAQKSGVYIAVSAPVQLEAVRLDARTGALSVTLEDAAAFAEKLVVLEARYSTLLGDALRQLAEGLSRRPIGQLTELDDAIVWCATRNVKETMSGYFEQAFAHAHEGGVRMACECGACHACLVRAGALLPF